MDIMISGRPLIAVNATALDSGGASTILKQFISSIEKCNEFNYLCYVPEGIETLSEHIKIVNVKKKGWISRILWDAFGLRKSLSQLNIDVYKVLSLQNTTMNVTQPQVIYLHQPLPFSDISWPVFNRSTFILYLYSKFYAYFIFAFYSKDTQFVVQTKWMADALCEKFNISTSNVHIIRPKVGISYFPSPIEFKRHSEDKLNTIDLLYPASILKYKNHHVILKAISKLSEEKIRFLVTFSYGDYPDFDFFASKLNIEEQVVYLGFLSSKHLALEYNRADLVVFPSYLETYGLPLSEAMFFRKRIIASDLPYSRDVLSGYPDAVFVKFDSSDEWAKAITVLTDEKINQSKVGVSADKDVNQAKFHEEISNRDDPWIDLIALLK